MHGINQLLIENIDNILDSPDRILVPLVGEDGSLGGAVVTHGLATPPAVMLSQTNSLLFIHRLHIPEKWSATRMRT